jgi:hypothetical protein
MNERLKELARQAKPSPNLIWEDAELERFAELVRQDERELCARTCDDMSEGLVGDDVSGASGASYCANAIRARGNHD